MTSVVDGYGLSRRSLHAVQRGVGFLANVWEGVEDDTTLTPS